MGEGRGVRWAVDIVWALVEDGADVSAGEQYAYGSSALEIAVSEGNREIVQILAGTKCGPLMNLLV